MSKIQKALRRLQSEPRPASRPVPDRVASVNGRARAADVAGDFVPSDLQVQFDQEALRDAGLIAPDYHERDLADQYREIKRPLIANAYGRRVAKVESGNLIMVTSALPGEGKTFTSINLALSMAQERDHSVLLVDADVAKPHITTILGLTELPGLLDVVEDRNSIAESFVLQTDIEGLSILPAGLPRDNATELLSSTRMEQTLRELADRFPERLVIFDTPPLLRTSEAQVIADLAGQVVLVVKAEDTAHAAVMEALHKLRDDQAVNLVLNQSRKESSLGGYGYGYGYGSGSGSGQGSKPASEPAPKTSEKQESIWGADDE